MIATLSNRESPHRGQVSGLTGSVSHLRHERDWAAMRSELLDARVAAELRAAPFSYPEVGATRGDLPVGYIPLRREVHIGVGMDYFQQARTALFGWHVHRAAGPKVISSSLQVTDDTVAVVRLGVGPLALRAPLRVVYVVDEPARAGFAYGTLPGHPESGEELFLVERTAEGVVVGETIDGLEPGVVITCGAEDARLAVWHDILDAARPKSEDREAGGQRLLRDLAESFGERGAGEQMERCARRYRPALA